MSGGTGTGTGTGDLMVMYGGKLKSVFDFPNDRHFYLRLPEFELPAYPRIIGGKLFERLVELSEMNPKGNYCESGRVIVEDAEFSSERRARNELEDKG